MLEQFIIFSRGGLVLFQSNPKLVVDEAITRFVIDILLEDRDIKAFTHESTMVQCRLINQYNLVVVASFEKILSKHLTHVDDLLDLMAGILVEKYSSIISTHGGKLTSESSARFGVYYERALKDSITMVANRNHQGRQSVSSNDSIIELPPSSNKAKKLSKAELAAQKRRVKKVLVKKSPSWQPEASSSHVIDKSDLHTTQSTPVLDIDSLIFDDLPVETDLLDPEMSKPAGLLQYLSALTNTILTSETLEPSIVAIKSHLIAKNVATEIADDICASVAQSLVGQTHSNFSSITATVKIAMDKALTRILTPKRIIDISTEIATAKSLGRPYSIVFVGVNGVGKSTSLAKVCAWLLKQRHSVMIAACDTFRSGAVEQLKVHSRALGGVPIFESGYGKDATHVAQQAILKAQTDGTNVVLIDTAGRMQDNEPLMESLAGLVKVNKPDLILFVGEALVGNVSVDQLTKFNRAIEAYGDLKNPRTIDGIILTKFDTVDEKVGAAISMTFTTGQPIVYVGVGQTYGDLRTLNVKSIVDILVKGS